MAQHIFKGTTPPSSTPLAVGHHYIDTVAEVSYIAIGTSSSADWQVTGGGGGGAVTSVNGQTGTVVLTKSDIGLGNADNTSDVNKPVSTAQAAADAAVQAFSIQRANHTGTQLASTISNFAAAASAAAPVQSVNGQTGTVVLTKSDVGLSNVDNTSDANKPVSIAQAAADAAVQAFSIQRANHTGTQLASTISDLTTAVRALFSATAPLSYISGTGVFSMPQASASQDGFLSAADFAIFSSGSAGDVVGPASSVDNTLARYNGTTGKLLQGSLLTVLDNGNTIFRFDDTVTPGDIASIVLNTAVSSLTLNPNGTFLDASNISQGYVNGSLVLSGAPLQTGASIVLNSAAGGPQFSTQFNNNGLAGNIDLAGQWTFGYPSASNRIHGFYKDILAGDTNSTITLQIGNSQTAQGKGYISYQNDVPTGTPTFDIGFNPRDNSDTTAYQGGLIRMQKSAASDATNMYFFTADISGNPKLTLTITDATVFELAPQTELHFDDDVGGQYVGLKAPSTVTGGGTYTLPDSFPAGPAVMTSDALGVMSWATSGAIFPLLAPNGSAVSPSYGFVNDTGQDTGMWTQGDGYLNWSTNATERMTLDPSGNLNVTGNITAANFPPIGNSNTFAMYDGSGNLISNLGYGYDPANFNGLRYYHPVIPGNTNSYNILHYYTTSYNPTVTDADDTWNQVFIESAIGTDDSGNQTGDYVDIKATLVVQDITYTSRRYGSDGNSTTIEYIGGGTAGSEVVTSPSQFEFVIQIEDGVSTANQIITAITNSSNPGDILGSLNFVVTGTGSNAQVIAPQTNLAGGLNANGSLNVLNLNTYNRNKSNTGNVFSIAATMDWGNGTDPINSNKLQTFYGNIILHDNATAQTVNGMELGFATGNVANSRIVGDLRGVNIFGNPRVIGGGLTGFQLGLNIETARFVQAFVSTVNSADDIINGVNTFCDFSNYSGDIGDNYYGVAIQPNINTTDGFFGINISPNVTGSRFNSTGVNVNMGGVNLIPGNKASVTVQDLFIESLTSGTGNNGLQIEYVNDGVAGSETVSIAGNTLTVHMEAGVSTATQIQTALLADFQVVSNFSVTVSGVGSNPQNAQSPLTITGGTDGGSKNAAQFNQGDVNINGGRFNSQYELNTANGVLPFVYGINNLGGTFKVQPGFPVTGGQFGILNQLAVGMDIEDDVLPDGTGFGLGTSMNGFLTQVGVAAGKTMDSLNFMAAGASVPQGSGNLTNLAFYRVIGLIPQGGTLNITNAYGFKVEPLLTATSPTNAWGVWVGDGNANNWFSKNVVIGGATGLPTGSYALDVIGDIVLDGTIHGTDGNESINSNDRHLIDSSGNNVVLWNSQLMTDGINDSLNWGQRHLQNTSGNIVLDWAQELLVDSTGQNSLNWNTRQIMDPSGTALIDYNTSNVVSITAAVNIYANDLSIQTTGKGIKIAEGSDAKMGIATLTAGTVTVSNTSVTANSRIFVTRQSINGSLSAGVININNVIPGTSFDIEALTPSTATLEINDNSIVAWTIIEPV